LPDLHNTAKKNQEEKDFSDGYHPYDPSSIVCFTEEHTDEGTYAGGDQH